MTLTNKDQVRRFRESRNNRFIYKIRGKRTLVKCNCPLTARAMAWLSIYLGTTCTLSSLMLKSWLIIANQIREFFYSYAGVIAF